MAAWVDVTEVDITSRWRPLTPAEELTIDANIEDAQDLLEEALEELGFSGPPAGDDRFVRKYKRVVTAIVRRVLNGVDGLISEEIDGYIYRRSEADASGDMFITDSEIARFRRKRRSAFSITPG